ncbi:MAG: electron transfer flavoprotein subunit alpha/FixB family protein [Bacteroidetes Order II. Incertae sedis bacterium]|jgi:electron transfer flavoprotein alpha subunit|nr:electron transfer flavoprotein subunit alpha/FixB family protein [Bacteroidetes Order II. bacterium]MBT4602172.1 electron transfer flavoprotein subunit alpha/FixB family protein [Bacteroidetes Order II. bacterium]MBT5250934.1 electron transfer flavoprotein subunit alpha/FixB family protein [Bacteroidetes Order II. bacterium]MBT6201195.1 electron transfer flavoprotein subunit alpha/FixB family protein [Bacteroidetes Order II. bacterium]MBT6424237.1 electron transfer flavoprotein subunit alpha
MNSILVYLSVHDARIKRSSLEALSRAREVGKASGIVVEAAILHSAAAEMASVAHAHGASKVFCMANPIFDSHLNAPLIAGLSKVIKMSSPRAVVMASTEGVKDVLGALAIRTDAAVLPDVASFDVTSNGVTCERPVMAAKLLASTTSTHPLVFISVRSGSYEVSEGDTVGTVEEVAFDFDEATLGATLREIVQTTGDTVDLSEANVVVAAGRGVRDESGKALVDELASITGAAIGASRAVVETGLFPATAQIGQTGKVVSPELYFAVGISGAIQHVAGMNNSRVIVAINKDADAPIFDVATYGLVGDCFKILPVLNAELRKIIS